jgi:hypothetical protein
VADAWAASGKAVLGYKNKLSIADIEAHRAALANWTSCRSKRPPRGRFRRGKLNITPVLILRSAQFMDTLPVK